ncbi:MAG: CopD family protein [Woeseiaceae bacterium]|nr:CopD family protein [Woeseiaceae bacterium]
MQGVLVFLHILAATVWTGGHLVLATVVLPKVLRERSPEMLHSFESAYERTGIPALIVQVVTGFWLAYQLVPDVGQWFDFDNPLSRPIAAKIALLIITILFALDARLRLIPNLSRDNLNAMAWHIVPVTIISVLFVFVGVAFRTGWLY